MKKVISIMGSPRKNKNTDMLLDTFTNGVLENEYSVKKVYLREKKISPCVACGYCEKTGECIIKDDMNEIYTLFDEGDIFVIASPLYFNTVSSLTKIMIDRCQKYFSLKYSLNKVYRKGKKRTGIFISAGGAPYSHSHFDASIRTMDLFFKAIDVEYLGNYFISGTDEKPVWDRDDVLSEIYNIGKNIDKNSNLYLHR